MNTVNPVIRNLGAWELMRFGLDSVTTNQSESFNCVLKKLQGWKEAPVDIMALSLFRLSQFHIAEVHRAQHGEGNWELIDGIAPRTGLAPESLDPDKIVDNIRNGVSSSMPNKSSDLPVNECVSDRMSSESEINPLEVQQVDCQNTGILSSFERAANVVNTGQISLDTKLGVFTVMGTVEPRVVRLHPKPSCSCPAQSHCYHIVAAQKAIGLHVEAPRRVLNLTQLRRNKRKRADKTSGRKKPRVGDIDIIPAPDAEIVRDVAPNVKLLNSQYTKQVPSASAVISSVRHFTDIFDADAFSC